MRPPFRSCLAGAAIVLCAAGAAVASPAAVSTGTPISGNLPGGDLSDGNPFGGNPSVGTGFDALKPARDPWAVRWLPQPEVPHALPALGALAAPALMPAAQDDGAQPTHAAAIEYSDAYQTRQKIHKYASFATLPLFAVQLALGEALYNPTTTATGGISESGASKGAHAFVGAAIVGLFAVNTATGAWNLFGEGWSNREGRPRRLAHGLLMMAADVGFLATSASGPSGGGRNGALTFTTDERTHRELAIGSMGVATVGYLLMLIGNH
jgi:hypothetical protein